MWPFRIVQLLYGDHVGGDLIETLANNIARRRLGRLCRVERNRFRVPCCDWRLDVPCLGEQIGTKAGELTPSSLPALVPTNATISTV